MEELDPAAVKKTTRIDQIVHEVVLCGGTATTGVLAERLIANGAIRVYADLRYSLNIAVERGLLRKTARGVYALREPSEPEALTDDAAPEPEPAFPAGASVAVEEGKPSGIDGIPARLELLLAEKRQELEALVSDQDQNLRVRAHVDELIAHNRAKMLSVEADIERLERLHRNAQEISLELGETKPAP